MALTAADFKRLGLSEYEARVASVLSLHPPLSAAQLSMHTGIARVRMYDVLRQLCQKGFVQSSASDEKPLLFQSVPISEAIEAFARKKKEHLNSELEELTRAKQDLTARIKRELVNASNAGPWGSACILKGRHIVDSRFGELFSRCQNEAVLCTNSDSLLRKLSLLEDLVRGHRAPPVIRLYTNSDEVLSAGFRLSDILRIVSIHKTAHNARFVVFDNLHALLFLNSESSATESALHVESPFVAAYLKNFLAQSVQSKGPSV